MFKKMCHIITLGILVFIAGCSYQRTFETQLTSFQRWPGAVAGEKYIFDRNITDNIEAATYANFLRRELAKTGLFETDLTKQARFIVSFTYNVQGKQQIIRREVDPFYADPYFGFGWPGPFFGTGFMLTPAPQVEVSAIRYNRYTLDVSIKDAKQGRIEVFKATAEADSNSASLPEVMPFLAQTVFDKFPGQNGQVRQLNFKLNDEK